MKTATKGYQGERVYPFTFSSFLFLIFLPCPCPCACPCPPPSPVSSSLSSSHAPHEPPWEHGEKREKGKEKESGLGFGHGHGHAHGHGEKIGGGNWRGRWVAHNFGIGSNADMQTFGYIGLHQCKHGVFAINENDTFIGKSMTQYGQWCEAELDLILPYLKPDDIALDCGANIGTHTVPIAKKCALVLAFEPQRLIFQNLCTNITLNNLVNVRPFNAALSDQPGMIQVPALDPRQKFNFGALSLQGAPGEAVPVMTIDQLGLPKCGLIKIDVEGFEAKVLQGGIQTIERCQPTLFVENDKADGSREILELLEAIGYDAWWHFCPYEDPDNFLGSDEPFWEGLPPAINLLCLPKGAHIEGLIKVDGVDDNWEKAFGRR